jgi:hypothetical protein
LIVAAVGHRHYPIQLWLFWRYATYWLVCGTWAMACLLAGLKATRFVVPSGLPSAERMVLGFAAGVYAFAVAIFLSGLAGLLGWWLAVLLPVAFLTFGRSALPEVTAFGRRIRLRTPSMFFLVASAWGVVSLAMIYLTIMTPENASFDARWYHLPIAEHYAAEGAIRRFAEGWFPGAYPHLASLLYTWAFCLPETALFDRVEIAAHLELVLFAATLASVPVLVRRLVPGAKSGAAWATIFLFPSVFVYDSNLNIGGDHVLAFWAIPIFLAWLRAQQRLQVRRCLLLALMLAGAALTKYQAGCLLIFPVVGILVVALRRRQWRGPLALFSAALLLTAPHWLKNWMWYGDPVYPILHRHLAGRPWNVDASAILESTAAEHLWGPKAPTLLGKLLETIGALFTFSFLPHDWDTLTRGVPMFGSLFSILVLTLPFVKGGRRLAPLVVATFSGLFAWYWVSHQDRYLQALLPWMAAVTAAAIVLIARTGRSNRRLLGGLVALQLVWGGSAYFTPSHPIIGSPVKTAADLLAAGFRQDYSVRLRPFGSWWDIGVALPKNAKVLVHEIFEHVGTRSASVSDAVGWQGGIEYGTLGGPRGVYDLLTSMGVTHIVYRTGASEGSDSLAGDLIFLEFVSRWGRGQRTFGHASLVQMPARPPPPAAPSDVVALVACGNRYRSGKYHLAQLSIPAKTVPLSGFPEPFAALGSELVPRFDDAQYAVLDTACQQPLDARATEAFTLLANRGTTQLWVRSSGAPSSVSGDYPALRP